LQQRRASREARPPQETLRQLRRDRRITQDQVAGRIGTTQTEVSKLERRSDMLVSTLDAYVEAVGGSLDLTVRFPGLAVRIKLAGRVTEAFAAEHRAPPRVGP
jgi:transcriptional regulator with XRE-family HTH domain